MMRTRTSRWWLAAAIALAGLPGAWAPAWAQSSTQAWPTKPIRLIVPLTPGSATDVMARVVMDQVSAQIGQPVIVENRPGAGNTIGMAAVGEGRAGRLHRSRQFLDPHRDPGDPLESGV